MGPVKLCPNNLGPSTELGPALSLRRGSCEPYHLQLPSPSADFAEPGRLTRVAVLLHESPGDKWLENVPLQPTLHSEKRGPFHSPDLSFALLNRACIRQGLPRFDPYGRQERLPFPPEFAL